MTSDWPIRTLRTLVVDGHAEIKTGPFGTNLKASEYTEHGAPVISVREIQLGRIEIDDRTPCVPPSVQESMPEYLLRAEDIVFARKGGIERSAWVRPEQDGYFLGSDGIRLRISGENVPRFVAYQVRSAFIQDWLRRHSTGSTMPSLSGRVLSLLPIVLPPVEIQHRIAAILGALDDKIELNRRMNRTLEEMAQALFKSWFIDFDGHEKFVDSNMGQIPHGWAEGSIETVGVRHRATVQPEDLVEGTPYVGLEHVPRRAVSLETWGVNEQVTSAKAQFQRGDILFGRLRPYFHKVVPAPMDGVCSTDILVVRPKADVWRWFVFGHLYSDAMVAHATASSSGTRMPRAKWADLVRFPFAVPPISRVAEFDACVRPMFERIWSNIFECRTLTTLRDTLLPKLISGELRVPEAEALAAEVL